MDNATAFLEGANHLLFCDESKFAINAGDLEDEIYYFGVLVKKKQVKPVNDQLKELLKRYKVQAATFHATTIFSKQHPRKLLMDAIASLISEHQLKCFCFKYVKKVLFEPTKQLKHLNSDIHDFENMEYQAFFYFQLYLNTFLREQTFAGTQEKVVAYFDRNVYGSTDVEAFRVPDESYTIRRMTFSEKSLISLLALPDFFGYIFRKSKQSHNRVQGGDQTLETSPLVINCHASLLKIHDAGLFQYLEVDTQIIGRALGIDFT